VKVVCVMTRVRDVSFVARLADRWRRRCAFVEVIGSLTFHSRGDEFNGLVHRGIVDAGHGLVGFLVTLTTALLRVEPVC